MIEYSLPVPSFNEEITHRDFRQDFCSGYMIHNTPHCSMSMYIWKFAFLDIIRKPNTACSFKFKANIHMNHEQCVFGFLPSLFDDEMKDISFHALSHVIQCIPTFVYYSTTPWCGSKRFSEGGSNTFELCMTREGMCTAFINDKEIRNEYGREYDIRNTQNCAGVAMRPFIALRDYEYSVEVELLYSNRVNLCQ